MWECGEKEEEKESAKNEWEEEKECNNEQLLVFEIQSKRSTLMRTKHQILIKWIVIWYIKIKTRRVYETERVRTLDKKKNDEKLPLNTLRNGGGGGGGKCLFSIRELINLKWNLLRAYIFCSSYFNTKMLLWFCPIKLRRIKNTHRHTQMAVSLGIVKVNTEIVMNLINWKRFIGVKLNCLYSSCYNQTQFSFYSVSKINYQIDKGWYLFSSVK